MMQLMERHMWMSCIPNTIEDIIMEVPMKIQQQNNKIYLYAIFRMICVKTEHKFKYKKLISNTFCFLLGSDYLYVIIKFSI